MINNDNNRDIKCFFRWLKIRERNGRKFPSSLDKLESAASHSALLKRLLDGVEPLLNAPPRVFGHPNYELIENGFYTPLEVWKPTELNLEMLKSEGNLSPIIIDQEIWNLISEYDQDHYLVRWPEQIERHSEVYKVNMLGVRDNWIGDPNDSRGKLWKMEKGNLQKIEGEYDTW